MFGEHSGRGDRFAFLSQSGAFAVAKMSKFAGFLPKYAVSIGNQTDLTVGDYLAWDFAVTRALAEAAGAIVTEELADFEDLVRLFLLLHDKTPKGGRLGAVSNAGFECVAIADNLGALKLADFQKGTSRRIAEVFARCRIDSIVDVHNPVDLTPMARHLERHGVPVFRSQDRALRLFGAFCAGRGAVTT